MRINYSIEHCPFPVDTQAFDTGRLQGLEPDLSEDPLLVIYGGHKACGVLILLVDMHAARRLQTKFSLIRQKIGSHTLSEAISVWRSQLDQVIAPQHA